MRGIFYASAVGSLMYAMLCTRPDIYFAVGMVNRYQSEPGEEHWIVVKHIFEYFQRTRDICVRHVDWKPCILLVHGSVKLILVIKLSFLLI